MRGRGRASLAAAKERLAAALAGGAAAQASEVGDDLFAVAGLLDREPGLRRALSDPARAASARVGLASGLLEGTITATALPQVPRLAPHRRSEPGALPHPPN